MSSPRGPRERQRAVLLRLRRGHHRADVAVHARPSGTPRARPRRGVASSRRRSRGALCVLRLRALFLHAPRVVSEAASRHCLSPRWARPHTDSCRISIRRRMNEEQPLELDAAFRRGSVRWSPACSMSNPAQVRHPGAPPQRGGSRQAARPRRSLPSFRRARATTSHHPDTAELARQLFPVARLFESLGFMSVARGIAHVERLLKEMAPEVVPASPPAAATAPARAGEAPEQAPAEPPPPPSARSPRPSRPRRARARRDGGRRRRPQPGGPHRASQGPPAADRMPPGAPHPERTRRHPDGRCPASASGAPSGPPARGSPTSLDRPGWLCKPRSTRRSQPLNQAAAVDVEAGVVHETAQELVGALMTARTRPRGTPNGERAAALLERRRDCCGSICRPADRCGGRGSRAASSALPAARSARHRAARRDRLAGHRAHRCATCGLAGRRHRRLPPAGARPRRRRRRHPPPHRRRRPCPAGSGSTRSEHLQFHSHCGDPVGFPHRRRCRLSGWDPQGARRVMRAVPWITGLPERRRSRPPAPTGQWRRSPLPTGGHDT